MTNTLPVRNDPAIGRELAAAATGRGGPGVLARLPVLLAGLLVAACATVTTGPSQDVSVLTEPDGATCTFTRGGETVGVVNPTPGAARIDKSTRDMMLLCRRGGYEDTETAVAADFQAMTLGNILIGGVIGVGVDALSGALARYPQSVTLVLTPTSFTTTDARDAHYARLREERRKRAERDTTAARARCNGSDPTPCTQESEAIGATLSADLDRLEQRRLAARVLEPAGEPIAEGTGGAVTGSGAAPGTGPARPRSD